MDAQPKKRIALEDGASAEEEMLVEVFQRIDLDASGLLDHDELRLAMAQMGRSEAETSALLERVEVRLGTTPPHRHAAVPSRTTVCNVQSRTTPAARPLRASWLATKQSALSSQGPTLDFHQFKALIIRKNTLGFPSRTKKLLPFLHGNQLRGQLFRLPRRASRLDDLEDDANLERTDHNELSTARSHSAMPPEPEQSNVVLGRSQSALG